MAIKDNLMIDYQPPMRRKPDMNWTNIDWMQTYAAIHALIHVYNNELSSGERHKELEKLKKLREKLEFMFREEADGK
jgi:hypothetical protein